MLHARLGSSFVDGLNEARATTGCDLVFEKYRLVALKGSEAFHVWLA